MTHPEIPCLDHGYVALVDTMGGDRTPAQTARTSFRNRTERSPTDDAKLTDYLVRNRHTTPLEFCQVRFYMKMPIFVARQLVRHRTASINEVSLRYVQAAEEFYVPEPGRCQRQSDSNKQGSADEVVGDPEVVRGIITASGQRAFADYQKLLDAGLSKELARTVLPLGTYTEWYWQCDLHNTLGLLRLRLDPHAQFEVRVYAQAMLDLIRPVYPTVVAAWERTLPQPAEAKVLEAARAYAEIPGGWEADNILDRSLAKGELVRAALDLRNNKKDGG